MAVLSQEDFLKRIQTLVGEDTSDEAIHTIEDFTDTYNNLHENSKEDWKTKYEQNDAEWRKKYKERFSSPIEIKKEQKEDVKEDGNEITFKDLFKEREG
jgi:hypothetical protein